MSSTGSLDEPVSMAVAHGQHGEQYSFFMSSSNSLNAPHYSPEGRRIDLPRHSGRRRPNITPHSSPHHLVLEEIHATSGICQFLSLVDTVFNHIFTAVSNNDCIDDIYCSL